MGREQRWNARLYRAVGRLLDDGGELALELGRLGNPSLADALRRQLGTLVLGLADGTPREVEPMVEAVQRTLDLAFRRVGVRKEVVQAYRALEVVDGLLAVRAPVGGPAVVREPPADPTTAAWRGPV